MAARGRRHRRHRRRHLITQMTTQQGADGWECQHALSAVSNATLEVWACGYSINDEAAEIASAMVRNAGK